MRTLLRRPVDAISTPAPGRTVRAARPLAERAWYPALPASNRALAEVLQHAPDARRIFAVNLYAERGPADETVTLALVLQVCPSATQLDAAAHAWSALLEASEIARTDPSLPYLRVTGRMGALPVAAALTTAVGAGHDGHFGCFDPPPLAAGPLSAEALALVLAHAAALADRGRAPIARELINLAATGCPTRDHEQALRTWALLCRTPAGTPNLPGKLVGPALDGPRESARLATELREHSNALLNPVYQRAPRTASGAHGGAPEAGPR